VPIPPNGLATLGVHHVSTLIMVSANSSGGPWIVQVRDAFGAPVAAGITDGAGCKVLQLPTLPGLRLDVIGTDALDVPIVAGHDVEVLLP
jgi:hypothetical protein